MRRAATRRRPTGNLTRLAFLAAASMLVAGCSTGGGGPQRRAGVVDVVAAENFWGSIAAQIGGAHASVTSLVSNPSADPHSYEPTAAAARAVADAEVVIENGAGYDPWMGRLIAADGGSRIVLDAGRVTRAPSGANPHLWYDPSAVRAVVDAYSRDLAGADPADEDYFARRARQFETVGLADYDALAARIRSRYAGTKVGASESIFAEVAPSLGLDLVTPATLLRAVSEGGEIPVSAKRAADRQIRDHVMSVYVYNAQNTTPDVSSQLAECKAAGVPTVRITETLAPASATFQDWQAAQLRDLLEALRTAAAGRPA